jgi:hypothetical protein
MKKEALLLTNLFLQPFAKKMKQGKIIAPLQLVLAGLNFGIPFIVAFGLDLLC